MTTSNFVEVTPEAIYEIVNSCNPLDPEYREGDITLVVTGHSWSAFLAGMGYQV